MKCWRCGTKVMRSYYFCPHCGLPQPLPLGWKREEVEICCPTCGLPKDICVCREIRKEQQRKRIRNGCT